MAKVRPQLPAIILERLPEKQSIYREILEHIQLTAINDRKRVFSLGKDLARLLATCVSNRNEAFWEWLENVGLDHPDVLGWKPEKIRRAMRLYERLKDLEEFLDMIQMRVQYYIADHAVNSNWIPLMRQQLMDGQPITVENFSSGIDPRIEDTYAASPRGTETTRKRGIATCKSPPSDGTVGLTEPVYPYNPDEGMFEPAEAVGDVDDDDEPMPWESNGHSRKQELLDADPPESGGEKSAESLAAQKRNLQNSYSGNGNGSGNGRFPAKFEKDDVKLRTARTAIRAILDMKYQVTKNCETYALSGPGLRGDDEPWYERFREGCEQAIQSLLEWSPAAKSDRGY